METNKHKCWGYKLNDVEHPAAREHFTKFLNNQENNQVDAERVEVLVPFGSVLIVHRFMFEMTGTSLNPTVRIYDTFDVQVFGKDGKEMNYLPGQDSTYEIEYMDDGYSRLTKAILVPVSITYTEEQPL